MALGFDPTAAPFDRLTGPEIETVRAALDIGYFRPGETILAKGASPDALFVVMKGHVESRDGEEAAASLGPGDAFDARALIQGGGGPAFVAREETLCHLLPRATAMRLIETNPRFAAFFYTEISRKLEAAAADAQARAAGATLQARVADLPLRPALFLDGGVGVAAALRAMTDHDCRCAFVRDGERIGVLTATDLARAAILDRKPLDAPIVAHATYEVIGCEIGDSVGAALVKMARHDKRRIAVRREGAYVGALEDTELLAFVAGGAPFAGPRIDRARDLDELASATGDIERQIRVLRRQGVRVDLVAETVSDLNRRLLARVFRLVAPRSVAESGCLIVMGSEGRAEQTLRTDQDNGLILSRAVAEADLDAFRSRFSDALARLGFPPCPGGVMARNPQWSKPIEAWLADLTVWTAAPSEDAAMNIAILFDAVAVAGDGDLVARVKADLIARMRGEPARLAHFARALDQFPTPIGLFNTLVGGDAIDLKKGGIFPIVHGARALALERGLEPTNTVARIEALAGLGVLDGEFARELSQSLLYLMTLKLDAALGLSAAGTRVDPGKLTGMDRDLLRDALRIVKQFKEQMRRHFNLGMF